MCFVGGDKWCEFNHVWGITVGWLRSVKIYLQYLLQFARLAVRAAVGAAGPAAVGNDAHVVVVVVGAAAAASAAAAAVVVVAGGGVPLLRSSTAAPSATTAGVQA